VGFSKGNEAVDIAGQLANWQAAGDQQIWKLIVSPEFGDRVDLSRLTRDLITLMEKDLGTELEWVATEHHNTEHPHVHVAIRGVRDTGETLRLSREYVKQGIRVSPRTCVRASSGIAQNLTGPRRSVVKSQRSGSRRSTAGF
jgi:type IV secretory pathway VirD2 relaxase